MIFKETATLWMLKGYQIRDHMGMSIQICKHSHPQSLHSPFLSPSSEISSSSVTSHIIQLAPSLTYILGRSVWSPISLASSFMTWINHWLMTFNHELREKKKKNSYQTTHESQIPKKIPCFFSAWRNSEGFFDFWWGKSLGKIISQLETTKLPLPSYSSWIPVSYQKAKARNKLQVGRGKGQGCTLKTKLFFWDCNNENSFNEIVFVKVKDDKAKTWMTRKQISWSLKTS